ncbi:MAG: hypothetical protein ACKO23_17725, partial [Gemmataceae bacterium]
MADGDKGQRLKLSAARNMVIEMMHHARKVPSIPVARICNLAPLAAVRRQIPSAPSWTTLFIRGYGLVARRLPGLRQAYMPLPFPHIYQHPHSVCALVVEREWQGEAVLVAGRVREPEALSLKEIGERIRALRETPVQEVAEFRQVLRLGRMPRIIRRLALSYALYLGGGFRRAKRLGTFMVSSYGTLGAEQLHPLTPLTTLLTFGPISTEGEVNVK